MDYASAMARCSVRQQSTYTAPCLGKVIHLKDLAIATESLMQFSRFEVDDVQNRDSGRSIMDGSCVS